MTAKISPSDLTLLTLYRYSFTEKTLYVRVFVTSHTAWVPSVMPGMVLVAYNDGGSEEYRQPCFLTSTKDKIEDKIGFTFFQIYIDTSYHMTPTVFDEKQ